MEGNRSLLQEAALYARGEVADVLAILREIADSDVATASSRVAACRALIELCIKLDEYTGGEKADCEPLRVIFDV